MSKTAQRRLAAKQRRAKTDPRFKMSALDAERKAREDEARKEQTRRFSSSTSSIGDFYKSTYVDVLDERLLDVPVPP